MAVGAAVAAVAERACVPVYWSGVEFLKTLHMMKNGSAAPAKDDVQAHGKTARTRLGGGPTAEALARSFSCSTERLGTCEGAWHCVGQTRV